MRRRALMGAHPKRTASRAGAVHLSSFLEVDPRGRYPQQLAASCCSIGPVHIMMASMGQLYAAFHQVVPEMANEPPVDGVCKNVRFVIMSTIVAPSVQMAYEEVYDPEIEEHTPEERALQLFESYMAMAPEVWWIQPPPMGPPLAVPS